MNLAAADFSQIPMSQSLAATLARASEAAGSLGSPEVSLEHVLLALCDDPDAEAVLVASRVDPARLRSETHGYLGSLKPQQSGGTLAVSPAVTRILEAAAAAARGGRRRDINGAIVLAAIVGDGKSAAAQILQAQGLTFDEAIRALQSALASPQRDAAPDFRPAEDVLAGARARVQSRSAPSLRDIMSDLPRHTPPPPAPMAPVPGAQSESHHPQWAPAPETQASPVTEQNVPPHNAPNAPVAAESIPMPVAAPDVSTAPPSTETSKPVGTYVYPASQTAPATAAPPATERPVHFDLPRPAPIATPPPIPPPIPQQGGGFGAPQPYAPMQTPLPQMHPQRWDGANPGPLGGHQGAQQGGFSPGQQNPGDPYAQLNRHPSSPPQMRAPGPIAGAPVPQKRRDAKPKAEIGQLAENIPRGMRVGKTERVEVRLAKASAKAITKGLEGGGAAWRHEVTVTQAMSVRLRAPDGGFFIETVSPETQWIENHLGFPSDEFASWRFLVTPQSRGWTRLQIVVSARTIGVDGMAAETALPDQVVEVKVRTNYKRAFVRLLGWTIAAVAGGAVAKFGENGLDIAQGLMQKFIQ